MPHEMTSAEWAEQPFTMTWSIRNHADEDAFRHARPYYTHAQFRAAFDKIRLDFTAPPGMPDGIHTVYHDTLESIGVSVGVIVRDGHFLPHPTEAAIMEAVAKSYGVDPAAVRRGQAGFDRVFIEDFRWHPETQRLQAFTGS